MTTVGCLRCGVWCDPGRSHLCGLLADETARGLAERIDAFERRLQGLDGEVRSLFNALERRVQELEAAQAQGDRTRADEDAGSRVRIVPPPAPPPAEPRIAPSAQPALDKRTAHASYMRAWRLRRALRRGDVPA